MLQKISGRTFRDHGPIKILHPGPENTGDSGIGSIGRIDHATFRGKQTIRMHPHVNDEILSYFRTGKVKHSDSEGFSEDLGPKKIMLMKAGKRFYHEEEIDGVAEPHEGLQIFIRPGEKDLIPEVIFQDLDELYSENKWRLLASPSEETKLRFSSQTWIFDTRLSSDSSFELPKLPKDNLTGLLYVYQGSVTINPELSLEKNDSLIFRDEKFTISTSTGAELVLFLTDENSPIFKEGMYSGNTRG
ncbi:pirin family protein [Sphingobacterium sp. BIGb0116]|uniref:pirin family protein n=1 Tax=Sphingobacterium sp. BIGb0116 TaxID=2940619 RepID=UPI00216A491F|nr:pirin family protein [Sphingobacterium sp. BIGb0116]MCS4168479.1 redox-sensitive bicupin YhaK (pirin superfamily) [Sphingobacterium sp. BIGb0116]